METTINTGVPETKFTRTQTGQSLTVHNISGDLKKKKKVICFKANKATTAKPSLVLSVSVQFSVGISFELLLKFKMVFQVALENEQKTNQLFSITDGLWHQFFYSFNKKCESGQ